MSYRSNWSNFIESLAYKQLEAKLRKDAELEFNLLWNIFRLRFDMDIERVISASEDIDKFTDRCLEYQFSGEKAQHCFAKAKSMRSLAILLLLIVRDITHMLRVVNARKIAQRQHLTDLIALSLTGAKLSSNFIYDKCTKNLGKISKGKKVGFFEQAIQKMDLGPDTEILPSSYFYRVFTCLGYQRETIFEGMWDCSDLIRELVDLNNALQKFISMIHFIFPHPPITLLPQFTRNLSKTRLEIKFRKILIRAKAYIKVKKCLLKFPELANTTLLIPNAPIPTPKIKHGHWEPHEEIQLLKAVNRFGEGSWQKGAAVYFFNTRTGTQLRDKWQNLLRYGHVTCMGSGKERVWVFAIEKQQ